MAYVSVSFRDANGELGNLRLPLSEPDAIETVGTLTLLWDNVGVGLQNVIEAVTLGVIAKGYFGLGEFDPDPAYPASNVAQREFGLRLYMTGDEDGRAFTVTLPTVDPSVLTLVPGRRDVVLADGGVMAALVAEFESSLRYPSTGASDEQSITINSAAIVGRNS